MIRADPSALFLLLCLCRCACQQAVDGLRPDVPSAPVADPCRLQTAPPDQIAHGPGTNSQALRRLSDGQIRRFLFVMQNAALPSAHALCVHGRVRASAVRVPVSRCAGVIRFVSPFIMPPTEAGCMLCRCNEDRTVPKDGPGPRFIGCDRAFLTLPLLYHFFHYFSIFASKKSILFLRTA